MKTLYLECNMGASGDMLMAALMDLLPNPAEFIKTINSIGIPHVKAEAQPAVKCGIRGNHVSVWVDGLEEESIDDHEHSHEHEERHHHVHSGIGDITHIIERLAVSQQVKANALAVYQLIAQAESQMHGMPVEQIHFHEVGTLDAVADVVGVCLLMEQLAPRQVLASPVHVGSGHVVCAHGVLPVPAPATALILQGVPIYGGKVDGELCTPTGAALLKHFVTKFGAMPVMSTDKIGYGMGKKDFAAANCLRAYLGETEADEQSVAELRCNLDDMAPEAIGYAQKLLFEEGALDVFTTPIQMKKDRPGTMLSCLCPVQDAQKMAVLMLRHTTTAGVRKTICSRHTMEYTSFERQTEYGPIRIKNYSGYGIEKSKPEYEDVAAAAKKYQVPFETVYQAALK